MSTISKTMRTGKHKITAEDLGVFLKGLEERITWIEENVFKEDGVGSEPNLPVRLAALEQKLVEVNHYTMYLDHLQLGTRMEEVEKRLDVIDGGKDHPQGSKIDWEINALKTKIAKLERTLKPAE
jgi:hypothetical protein